MKLWMPAICLCVCGLLVPSLSEARFKKYCSDCHTMHNSQNSDTMVSSTSIPYNYGSGTRQSSLLIYSCVGCHAGTNSQTIPGKLDDDEPYVLTTAGVSYGTTGTEGNTLSGGDFSYLSSGDSKGHNVQGIADEDLTLLRTPPGGGELASQLKCAGTYGCHGEKGTGGIDDQAMAIHGSHHSKSTDPIDGSTVPKSYRWLLGVTGYEDSDYEYRPTSSNHNQYQGKDRSSDNNPDPNTTTISHFCADCHGDFHNGANPDGIDGSSFSSPWIRHPVDYDMKLLTGEYASFNRPTVNAYSVAVPLASINVTVPLSMVRQTVGDSVIMCLSCHRAHGTPYDSILRWDYKGWPTGGFNGCAICHTSKN